MSRSLPRMRVPPPGAQPYSAQSGLDTDVEAGDGYLSTNWHGAAPNASLPYRKPPSAHWTPPEQSAFTLGMYLWGSSFEKIARLVGSKSEAECRAFYTSTWESSDQHMRYKDAAARSGLRGEQLLGGRKLVTRWLPEVAIAARLDGEGEARAKHLVDEYIRSRIDLEQLVLDMVDIAGRDAVVGSVDLAEFGGQGGGGLVLTPRKMDALLRTSLPVKSLFLDSVWPQLEAQGWGKDAGAPRQGAAFYPPHTPSTSSGDPAGIASIRGVLEYLQSHPEQLPRSAVALEAARGSPSQQQHSGRGREPRQPPPAPRGGGGYASVGSGKVCENCGTTSTPLWRKDRQANMMMCNACGIYYKNHGRHRPVELALHPPRLVQHPRGSAPPLALAGVAESDGELTSRGGMRRRSLPPQQVGHESDLSEQSDDDGERRRSLRPRRQRDFAAELDCAPADLAEAQYDSETGSDTSSVLVLDEAEAEQLRSDLINRLVREASIPADFEGAVEGLHALKRARITDPVTGESWGVVRVYADPSTTPHGKPPAAARLSPAASKQAAKPKAPAVPRPPANGKPGQTCANCGTSHTPLWRKDRESGLMMCNACGIYYKTHGVHRPLGTSRFKQYSGPSITPNRGKAKRAAAAAAKKAGSPSPSKRRVAAAAYHDEEEEEEWGAGHSESELGEESNAEDEEELTAETSSPQAVRGGVAEHVLGAPSVKVTSSGRAVRQPRRGARAASADVEDRAASQEPPPELAAAPEPLPLVAGLRCRPSRVAVISLFKPSPQQAQQEASPRGAAASLADQVVPGEAYVGGSTAAAAALRQFFKQQQPKVSSLSTSSDNSAYSPAAAAVAAGMLPRGGHRGPSPPPGYGGPLPMFHPVTVPMMTSGMNMPPQLPAWTASLPPLARGGPQPHPGLGPSQANPSTLQR